MNTNQKSNINYTVFNGDIYNLRKEMNVTIYDDLVAWEHLVLLVRNTPAQIDGFINDSDIL